MTERQGEYIQAHSGQHVYPLYPAVGDFNIKDIAHALSNLCRFNGHCSEFYSVAQHSVMVSMYLPDELQMWGLLHDAAEAYIGDLPRPLKRHGRLGDAFVDAENVLLACIAEAFKLSWPMPEAVHQADLWMLCAEGRDLMGNPEWVQEYRARVHPPLEPVPTIDAWPPAQAEVTFLLQYYALKYGE